MNYHSRYPSSSVTPLIFHIPKCSQKCPAYIFLKSVINNRTGTRHPPQNYCWSKRLRDRVGVSFLSFQQNEYFHNFRCTVIYFTESSIMCQTFYPNEVKIHENVCIHFFLFYAPHKWWQLNETKILYLNDLYGGKRRKKIRIFSAVSTANSIWLNALHWNRLVSSKLVWGFLTKELRALTITGKMPPKRKVCFLFQAYRIINSDKS